MSVFNQLAEAAARQHSPHLWDGRLAKDLARIPWFHTDDQVNEAVERKRAEKIADARDYLTGAIPELISTVRDGADPAYMEGKLRYDDHYEHGYRQGVKDALAALTCALPAVEPDGICTGCSCDGYKDQEDQ